MNRNNLVLAQLLEADDTQVARWRTTIPTTGVAILDVAVGETRSPAPLHWRAGDWTKPPLDIRLGANGRVEGIQVVWQDERIREGEVVAPADAVSGHPRFDVESWPPSRYADVRVSVTALRLASGELYVTIGAAELSRAVAVAEGLRFDLDRANCVVGIALGPLTPDDWQCLASSALP